MQIKPAGLQISSRHPPVVTELAGSIDAETRDRSAVTIASTAPGGISSVVQSYIDTGFAERHGMVVIASHRPGGFLARLGQMLAGLWRLLTMLRQGSVSLVHCHVAAYGSFYRKGAFAELARWFGVPVIWHVHASEMKVFHARQGALGRRMIRGLLERATVVIALSESWHEFILSVAPRAQVEVVRNFVCTPADTSATPSEATILKLGLIGARKGSFDLLHAFALLLKTHSHARLVIGGNGAVDEARSLAAQLGIGDRVDLPGWVGPADKDILLAQAQIYVLPSHNEGLPMSVLEAMMRGLPVVTTPVGGLPELIETGRTGLLVPPGDPVALAAALATLLDDPERRASLAAAGKAHVREHYSEAAMVPKLEAIYRRLGA